MTRDNFIATSQVNLVTIPISLDTLSGLTRQPSNLLDTLTTTTFKNADTSTCTRYLVQIQLHVPDVCARVKFLEQASSKHSFFIAL
jgi:hypothetical protein